MCCNGCLCCLFCGAVIQFSFQFEKYIDRLFPNFVELVDCSWSDGFVWYEVQPHQYYHSTFIFGIGVDYSIFVMNGLIGREKIHAC